MRDLQSKELLVNIRNDEQLGRTFLEGLPRKNFTSLNPHLLIDNGEKNFFGREGSKWFDSLRRSPQKVLPNCPPLPQYFKDNIIS